jgi:DNA repair exonuclease SbcCD ATPase subunit
MEISRALGVQEYLSRWTIYIDGDQLRFSSLSQKDSVDLLMGSLNQPPWTQYHENVKKTKGKFEVQLEGLDSRHREYADSMKDTELDLREAEDALRASKKRHREYEALREERVAALDESTRKYRLKLSRLEARQKEIKKLIEAETARGAEEYKNLELDRKHALSMCARAGRFKERLTEKRAVAREKLERAKEKADELEAQPKACPTCGKAWDRHCSRQELADAQEVVEIRRERVHKLKALYEKACHDEEKYRGQQETADDKIDKSRSEGKVTELSGEHEVNQREVVNVSQSIDENDAEAKEAGKNPHDAELREAEAIVRERTKNLDKSRDRLAKVAQEIVEVKESLKVVQYWADAFGPYGIPNMILKETISPLNSISKRLSTVLTAGVLNVHYSTSRELASGREKSELVIKTENKEGATKVEGSSKGEGGISNLIIAETIAEIGMVARRVGFRWYDEVVNSQDPVVRRNIFSYLKDVARTYGILVFVVDHHPETGNYADHILLAEKTSEHGTKYSWM